MKIKWIHIILPLLLVSCFGVKAQDPEELFELGNQAFEQQNYDTAIQRYEQILDLGYESVAVYYNLGNSYYRNNRISQAILNYERAAALDPSDEDVRQNLQIAREQTIDQFEKLPEPLLRTVYLGLMKMFSPDGWAVLGLLMLLIFVSGLALYLFSNRKILGFNLGWIGLVLGIVAISLAFAHQSYRENNRPAIVTAMSSYVKTAPSEASEDSFILHEGSKPLVRDSVGDWKKIRMPDGKIGWIKSEDIEEI